MKDPAIVDKTLHYPLPTNLPRDYEWRYIKISDCVYCGTKNVEILVTRDPDAVLVTPDQPYRFACKECKDFYY